MRRVLTLNGGSSSIRFAIYDATDVSKKILDGKIDRIGAGGAQLTVTESQHGASRRDTLSLSAPDHGAAASWLMNWLGSHHGFDAVEAVGHRVVHGMHHASPERVTVELLDELRRLVPYDPEHLPLEIEMIDAVSRTYPELAQVACFDTAFHHDMPRVAAILPIPRRYEAKGVRRYGFHGLSYTYLMTELMREGDPAAVRGRIILAHLGNGASLAAVRDGRSIDTSMGFTPTAGLVMSTRSGDLDPGIQNFLAVTESMSPDAYQRKVTRQSGLLGVSETSSDLRDLVARAPNDVRAAEAVALFCYQVKKWTGAFAAALGGVDTLVFTGGIGEHAADIRAQICAGLEFLGIELDSERNARNAAVISVDAGRVIVRVIPTDEESVIARAVLRNLGWNAMEEG